MVLSDYISRYRQAATTAVNAIETLHALDQQFTNQNLGAAFAEGDFAGTNSDYTPSAFAADVETVIALETALEANGNAGWLAFYRLRGQ